MGPERSLLCCSYCVDFDKPWNPYELPIESETESETEYEASVAAAASTEPEATAAAAAAASACAFAPDPVPEHQPAPKHVTFAQLPLVLIYLHSYVCIPMSVTTMCVVPCVSFESHV